MPMHLYVGLMSGTSMDGADAVLADCSSGARVVAHRHGAFPGALRDALFGLQQPGADELHRAALAGNALADHYAELVRALLADAGLDASAVRAVGAHGQTVRHRPELGYTLQINAPARLAEAIGIDVIADFRSRDVAAGGQGAPLVPAFHASVFGGPDHRAVLNLGGIANVTDLPPGGVVRGWDTGPANVLSDGWIGRARGLEFDAAGAWAASGTVQPDLLAALLAEPWLMLAPPKSTGRDRFNMDWLDAMLARWSRPDARAVDIQATLVELTAVSVARSIAAHIGAIDQLIVCGGGARNDRLLNRLAHALRALNIDAAVVPSSVHGVAPDHVEGLAFAWLAQRFCLGLAGNLPAVTGALGERPLGALYPAGLKKRDA